MGARGVLSSSAFVGLLRDSVTAENKQQNQMVATGRVAPFDLYVLT